MNVKRQLCQAKTRQADFAKSGIQVLSRIVIFALVLLASEARLHAQAGVMPKTLIVPNSPAATAQLSFKQNGQVAASISPNGVAVTIKPGEDDYPGITIKPEDGSSWDLGSYGHVEAKVANTGKKTISLSLRVDNDGDYRKDPWNAEAKNIEPGQTKTLRVYFGYSYGFHPAFKLNPRAVTQLILFTGKTQEEFAFRVENIQGAGYPGENTVDPDRVGIKPPAGVLLGPSVTIQAATQIHAIEGARGSLSADGKSLQADFTGGKQQSVTLRPAAGLWNLNEQLELKVLVQNVGQIPVTPAVRIESEAGPSDSVAADAPLAPGAQAEIVVPFAAKAPWRDGTSKLYYSNATTGVTILSDQTPGAKTVLVNSVVADLPKLALPDWLGQRPPVPGDWVQTLDEEFAGHAIDPHRWNVHPDGNWWDKRMHFSKDEIIVQDGLLHLRMEKKPGRENDDPKGALTDYAAGQPDTYGKWTQRYGYFEIREKQPTANCLWPGFWMMPDRGLQSGSKERTSVSDGGMEMDVTESQSAWGAYRFNVACHWDAYTGPASRGLGTSANYVQPDRDGFIVVGLLWTPGSMIVYGNGKEIFHWDNPRVASVQEYLILQNEIGGWDNAPVNDTQLPADLLVKYIRVWQRKDLASSDDGPKPNHGGLDAFHETLPAVDPAPEAASKQE